MHILKFNTCNLLHDGSRDTHAERQACGKSLRSPTTNTTTDQKQMTKIENPDSGVINKKGVVKTARVFSHSAHLIPPGQTKQPIV